MAGIEAFADDLAVEQIRVDAGADFDDDSGPLVAWNDRVPDEPRGAVGRQASTSEPQIPQGDVDDDLTGIGMRLLELRPTRWSRGSRCVSLSFGGPTPDGVAEVPVSGVEVEMGSGRRVFGDEARSSSTPSPGAVGSANSRRRRAGSPIAAC